MSDVKTQRRLMCRGEHSPPASSVFVFITLFYVGRVVSEGELLLYVKALHVNWDSVCLQTCHPPHEGKEDDRSNDRIMHWK